MHTEGNQIVSLEIDRAQSNFYSYTSDHQVLELLSELKGIFQESFVIATCQRFCIYAYTNDLSYFRRLINSLGSDGNKIRIIDNTETTVKHLFKIAAGLNSRIIGEHEILGQLRKSLAFAQQIKAIGPHLEALLRQAIFTGNKVRSTTTIGSYNLSYTSIGLSLVKEHFLAHNSLTYLVVGTGSLANNFLAALSGFPNAKIFVFSHNLYRAQQFSSRYNATPCKLEEIQKYLPIADVLVGGTHGEVNFSALYSKEERCRRGEVWDTSKNILVIDYGIPANFPSLINSDHYYSLENIMNRASSNDEKRKQAIPEVLDIVNQEKKIFLKKYHQKRLAKLTGGLWTSLESIKDDQLKWLMPKLQDLTENERILIEKFSHKLIRNMAKLPFAIINDRPEEFIQDKDKVAFFQQLFNLKS